MINRSLIPIIVLLAMASVSCAQSTEKNVASHSGESGPELRWKYEAGG